MPPAKKYFLSKDEMTPLAPGRGSCMASDRITVDGFPVCYMYREAHDEPHSSGWMFFAGDETQEYADDPDNFDLYDVNTIANIDPDIIPYLDAPVETAFARENDDQDFEEVPFPSGMEDA